MLFCGKVLKWDLLRCCIGIVAVVIAFSSFSFTYAQELPVGIAEYVSFEATDVLSGSIVVFTDGTFSLSSEQYSPYIVGVVTTNPAIAINVIGEDNTYPIVKNGKGQVLVSTENGPIAVGDLITSSSQPGVGMKADRPGFIVGAALQTFDSSEPGTIEVQLGIQRTTSSTGTGEDQGVIGQFRQVLSLDALAALEEPSTALKYTLAAITILTSLAFSIFLFGRVASNGIAAIGRNPLARRFIGVAMLFNIFMTVAVALLGFAVAYFILVL